MFEIRPVECVKEQVKLVIRFRYPFTVHLETDCLNLEIEVQ